MGGDCCTFSDLGTLTQFLPRLWPTQPSGSVLQGWVGQGLREEKEGNVRFPPPSIAGWNLVLPAVPAASTLGPISLGIPMVSIRAWIPAGGGNRDNVSALLGPVI